MREVLKHKKFAGFVGGTMRGLVAEGACRDHSAK